MKTLKVTLKQHTPLIHFQHNQYGATLRASEVKPKLDKFLLERLKHDPFIIGKALLHCKKSVSKQELDESGVAFKYIFCKKEENWMGSYDSLSYKLRIVTNREDYVNLKMTSDKFPFMLCNMDKEEDDLVQFSFYKKIDLVFTSKYTSLIDKIVEYLDDFLAITNFGSRQNKGFGSFFTEDKTLDDFKKSLSSSYHTVWTKEFSYRENLNGFNSLFNDLDKTYKSLKSGKRRIPSSLSYYFKESDQVALKNYIKKGISPIRTNYIRACLGITNELNVSGDCTALIEHCCGNDEEKIERYQSPIMFKVFNQNIFLIYCDTFNSIANKTFKFSFVDKETKENVFPPQILNTPQKFNIEKFLEKYLKSDYKKIGL